MRRLIGIVAFVAVIMSPAFLSAQGQINPINSYKTSLTASGTAVVTIPGVQGQRVRLYSIGIYCGGATNIIPAIQVTDTGNLALDEPGVTMLGITNPPGSYRWSPGYAFSLGGTVVITGNPGSGCTGGTFMTVQADQF